MEQHPHIVFVKVKRKTRVYKQPHHIPLLDHNALRLPRSARGIDDIGKVRRAAPPHAVLRTFRGKRLLAEVQRRAIRRNRERCFSDKEHLRPAVLQNKAHPLGRIGGIDRHISAACLQNTVNPHDRFQAALDIQRYKLVCFHAHRAEPVRKLVRLRVQLRVGQAFLCEDDRRPIRRFLDLRFKQLHDRLILRIFRCRIVERTEDHCLLLLGDGSDLAELLFAVLRDLFQYGNIMTQEPRGAVAAEQVAAIFQTDRIAAVRFLDVEGQVEFGHRVNRRQHFRFHAVQSERAMLVVLHDQHHVKQRVAGDIPPDMQRFYQRFKRIFLILIGSQAMLLDLA